MTSRTSAKTVVEVLARLDDDFLATATAVAEGECVLWLGSGISRGVVPGVDILLERLLTNLQRRIAIGDPSCRFRTALTEVLGTARLPEAVRARVDLSVEVGAWPDLTTIIELLTDRYAAVLDVRVDGEDPDFLVWDGLEVAQTYGSSTLVPDVEHLCIAILMLEGAVTHASTTNWDGLVETAVGRLSSHPMDVLKVVVLPADFAAADKAAELIKFHGCAVLARGDEATYRAHIIARETQISGWASRPDHKLMKDRLEFLLAAHPGLVIGLSAQDQNIHTMFNEASQNLTHSWPTSPPAMVFATEHLGPHHTHMLKVVYGDVPYSQHRAAIEAGSTLGAYAKPTLVALVLYVIGQKLRELLRSVPDLGTPAADLADMQDDITALRDIVASRAASGTCDLVEGLIQAMRVILTLYRTGRSPAHGLDNYEPLTVRPASRALTDPDFPGAPLGRLGLAASLLGRGCAMGAWSLRLAEMDGTDVTAVHVVSGSGRSSAVLMVRDASVLTQLELTGQADLSSSDVCIVCTDTIPHRSARSPGGRYGRTGVGEAREVDLAELGRTAADRDSLFESFRLEGAL